MLSGLFEISLRGLGKGQKLMERAFARLKHKSPAQQSPTGYRVAVRGRGISGEGKYKRDRRMYDENLPIEKRGLTQLPGLVPCKSLVHQRL